MRKKAEPKNIKIITLDTETYNGLIGKLKRIAIYDGVTVTYGYSFLDIEPVLLDYVAQGFEVHIYIHNLEFDSRKIPELFDKSRINWNKCFVINGKLATLACKNYIIHDSFKILPMSLSALSGKKGFDVEHGKLDLWENVQKIYPNQYENIVDFLDKCPIDDDLYLEYLGYDVISLYEILQKLLEVSGLTDSELVKLISTASLSRYIFKNGFKGHEFLCGVKKAYDVMCSFDYTDKDYLEDFLRCGYYGGRTEVFKMKLEEQGYHYDVNSLYPYEMKSHEYPIGKPIMNSHSDFAEETFLNWQKDRIGTGFLSCTVYVPYQHIPPLPVKIGKLIFPTGVFCGVWQFEELQTAIELCGAEIKKYDEVCFFYRTANIFEDFVNTFANLKITAEKEGNYALRYLSKLILNTGYGYTATRRDKEQLRDISYLEKHSDEKLIYADEELGFCEIATRLRSKYIQVGIGASVTAFARIDLLKGMITASKKGNVYYCDTDSIVTDMPMSNDFVDEHELGKFKLESVPKKALFLKPKVYAEVIEDETEVKFKGISKDTQKTLSFDNYEFLYKALEEQKEKSVTVEKDKLLMRSVMYTKKKQLDINYYEKRDKNFNLSGQQDKRRMNYQSNTTQPLYFDNVKQFLDFDFDFQKVVDLTKIKEGLENDS